jgi:hypothetical protein
MAGYPAGRAIFECFDLVERDDFRSGVQKQSLPVTCRFRAWASGGCRGGRRGSGC